MTDVESLGFDIAGKGVAKGELSADVPGCTFGMRGYVRVVELGDMSPSRKAATCRRTPEAMDHEIRSLDKQSMAYYLQRLIGKPNSTTTILI